MSTPWGKEKYISFYKWEFQTAIISKRKKVYLTFLNATRSKHKIRGRRKKKRTNLQHILQLENST